MMEVDDLWFWVVDGSSIEYLDLRTCEFQREKIPRLISSLDLSLPPTPPTAPYVPLIPVFETTSGRMSVIFPNWTATVFFDFSRNILQNLELNWEEDIAKLYVSHLRAFCHYVETCFYSANCFRTTSISSPQSKRKTLPRYKTELINSLKLEATWKLVRNLFGNVRLDSGVIMDILDPICSWKKLAQISLKSDPAIADSILSHLRRNQRWVTTEELMKFFSSDKLGTIRKRPKNLLVFLNHGFKNLCNPTYLFLNRMIFEMRAANPHFWNVRDKILDCFRRKMPMDKREAMILEMCAIFLCCDERNLSNYIESMCYIWRSIPDVYITLEEIKHTLFKFLAIENDKFVEDICQELQRRGFNGFEDKQETNNTQNAQREEPKSKIEDLRSAKSLLSGEYDSADDRLKSFREEKRYSRDSKLQLLEEKFCPNSQVSKNPESLTSLPRGLFLPYTFRDPDIFLECVSTKLLHLTRVAKSLINDDNSTIQPHTPFAHNLGAAEEVLAGTSQSSEESGDPINETRNPFQYSREAVRNSVTQNPKRARDSIRPKKGMSEEAMRYGATSSSYLPERTVDQPNTNSPFSQVPEIPEIPISQPRNLSETLAVGAPTDDLPNRVPRICNPLFAVKNEMHSLRSIIRELLNRNPQWTEDSDLQARQQQRDNNNEDKTTNTSISSSKLPKEHGNFMNLPNLSPDSRSARSRNKRDSNFRLPDEGIRMNPPKRIKFSYSQEPMRYGAIYDPNFPEEIEYHQNKNDLLSQAPGNPEILVSRTRNIAESRIRTVMARILTIPDRMFVETLKFENAIRDLMIRYLQWTEGFADPYIENLQLLEEPGNSNIQTSSLFTCRPGGMEGLPNSNSQIPSHFHSLANFMSRVFGLAMDNLFHATQRAYDPVDRQTRDSQYLEVPDPAGPQPRRLLHYSRCVIRDALILNSQLPQGITFLKLPNRLQSYLKLEL